VERGEDQVHGEQQVPDQDGNVPMDDDKDEDEEWTQAEQLAVYRLHHGVICGVKVWEDVGEFSILFSQGK